MPVMTTTISVERTKMQKLGIEMIAAYSPEARGRSERVFGTLQGRLPQELASQAEVDEDDGACVCLVFSTA